MSNKNCGYCYNRGCRECEPALRAAEVITKADSRAAWRAYAAAYLANGRNVDDAFTLADEALRAEGRHFARGPVS